MHARRDHEESAAEDFDQLKTLTAEQFMALGGNAVAFVRKIRGDALADMLDGLGLDDAGMYQLVMSADGNPLMVADTSDAVMEWMADRNVGLVTLH